MTSNEIKVMDTENVMQTYGRFDVVIDHGKGSTLYSPEGKEYIDFTSGIGVNSLGYGNKKWSEAIYAQSMKLQHISNLYYTEPYARLAAVLTKRTGMNRVFFANSGAESNEGMIKLARKYSYERYGKGRSKILTLEQSFHGRTVTTLAATGQESFHKYFFPFTEGFAHIPANNTEVLEKELSGDICAIMIELIQGEGGVLPLEEEYVKKVRELSQERDILLLIDEVQTGIGRTGTLFAYEQYGIKPDVISFAKGIGGGLPIGGFMCREEYGGVLGQGDHAATFGGNPIAAAGAVEVLNQLSHDVLSEVTKKGEYIRTEIETWSLPIIGTVRGCGLMLGIPIKDAKPKEVAIACAEKGLLILTAGQDALRMLPPLLITYNELDKGLGILRNVLEEYTK